MPFKRHHAQKLHIIHRIADHHPPAPHHIQHSDAEWMPFKRIRAQKLHIIPYQMCEARITRYCRGVMSTASNPAHSPSTPFTRYLSASRPPFSVRCIDPAPISPGLRFTFFSDSPFALQRHDLALHNARAFGCHVQRSMTSPYNVRAFGCHVQRSMTSPCTT